MKRSVLVLVSGLTLGSTACDKKPEPSVDREKPAAAAASSALPTDPQPSEGAAPTTVSGVVTELHSLPSYTYLLLDTGSEKVWAAVPATKLETGAKVTVERAVLMRSYRSTALNRDFDRVYFGTLAGAPAAHGAAPPAANPHAGATPAPAVPTTVRAERATEPDGKTVEEAISQVAKLAGKPVTVRGVVVKANPGILGKTWLHLQDGSGSAAAKTNDLTVTVPEQHRPTVGAVVTVRGKLARDKDVGGGYQFAVLLEGDELRVEPAKK